MNEPFWYNYFLCGLKGVLEEYPALSADFSLNCYVDGRIPPSAGLSSSSALVVAAAMTAVKLTGAEVTKTGLADLCAKSERFIGTQGGGMDQAIEILAEAGTANLIEFNPLRQRWAQERGASRAYPHHEL